MDGDSSRSLNRIFTPYVGVPFTLLVIIWFISNNPVGYWLQPVQYVLFIGFWETRFGIQTLFGRSFVMQIILYWGWLFAYTAFVSIVGGNLVRGLVTGKW